MGFKRVSRGFQEGFKRVSRGFQEGFKRVSRGFQWGSLVGFKWVSVGLRKRLLEGGRNLHARYCGWLRNPLLVPRNETMA